MDDKRLAIAHIGQVASHLQIIHHRADLVDFSGLAGYQLRRREKEKTPGNNFEHGFSYHAEG
jgi:hypothetical protein